MHVTKTEAKTKIMCVYERCVDIISSQNSSEFNMINGLVSEFENKT